MHYSRSTTLHCFSPEVIFITFVVEVCLSVYTLLLYARRSIFGRLSALFLFSLAFFQIAEFIICMGISPDLWARLGYIAITMLPPLGYHLISLCTKKTNLTPVGYTAALALSLYIILSPEIFHVVSCTGKFVAFTTDSLFSQLYSVYYIGLLLAGLVQLAMYIRHKDADQYLITWFIAAYLSFMFPMAILYLLVVSARIAVPSIMCGFALLTALIVFAKILPRYHLHRKS